MKPGGEAQGRDYKEPGQKPKCKKVRGPFCLGSRKAGRNHVHCRSVLDSIYTAARVSSSAVPRHWNPCIHSAQKRRPWLKRNARDWGWMPQHPRKGFRPRSNTFSVGKKRITRSGIYFSMFLKIYYCLSNFHRLSGSRNLVKVQRENSQFFHHWNPTHAALPLLLKFRRGWSVALERAKRNCICTNTIAARTSILQNGPQPLSMVAKNMALLKIISIGFLGHQLTPRIALFKTSRTKTDAIIMQKNT